MIFKTEVQIQEAALRKAFLDAQAEDSDFISVISVDETVDMWLRERNDIEEMCTSFFTWVENKKARGEMSPDCTLSHAFKMWYEPLAPWNKR